MNKLNSFICAFTTWFRVFVILSVFTAAWLSLSSFAGTFWPPDLVPHPHVPEPPKTPDHV